MRTRSSSCLLILSRVTGHASRVLLALLLRARQATTPTNALPMKAIESGSGMTAAPPFVAYLSAPFVAVRIVFRLGRRKPKAAKLGIAGTRLPVADDGSIVIPSIELHDVLVLTLK